MSILDTKVAGSNLSINMFSPWAWDFIRIASVDSAVKWVPGGDNLVKGVQCYELFGGIALKNHTFSFSYYVLMYLKTYPDWLAVLQTHWHIFIYCKLTERTPSGIIFQDITRWNAVRMK